MNVQRVALLPMLDVSIGPAPVAQLAKAFRLIVKAPLSQLAQIPTAMRQRVALAHPVSPINSMSDPSDKVTSSESVFREGT